MGQNSHAAALERAKVRWLQLHRRAAFGSQEATKHSVRRRARRPGYSRQLTPAGCDQETKTGRGDGPVRAGRGGAYCIQRPAGNDARESPSIRGVGRASARSERRGRSGNGLSAYRGQVCRHLMLVCWAHWSCALGRSLLIGERRSGPGLGHVWRSPMLAASVSGAPTGAQAGQDQKSDEGRRSPANGHPCGLLPVA